MNLHSDTLGSEIIFVGIFISDDEANNFYNAYARNRGFKVRKKGIEKSWKPQYVVICRK